MQSEEQTHNKTLGDSGMNFSRNEFIHNISIRIEWL